MKLRTWISSLAMLACATLAQAQDKFSGMGFFVGVPTPASAVPAYNSFVKVVKQTPNVSALFIDYRDPIWSAGTYDLQWRVNANWAASNFATLARQLNRVDANGDINLIPIISMGLTDNPTAFQLRLAAGDPRRGKYSEAAAVAMMKDIANGKYDRDDAAKGRHNVWPAIFDAFRAKGFRRIYVRLGWEENGDWFGWQARTAASRSAYLAAWRHVADLAHDYAAEHAMTIQTVWSPSVSYANYGASEELSYPGDAYVDVIAPDAYSPIWNATRSPDGAAYHDWSTHQNVTLAKWYQNPINRRQSWDNPASDYWNPSRGWGLPEAMAFAISRNKPFGLSETGTGNQGVVSGGGGPLDEGEYPRYLAERLAAAISQGLTLEFVDVWAQPNGPDNKHFLSGARPLEAAAWREFAANMAAATQRRNVASKKPTVASSSSNSTVAAGKATDGTTATRWSSKSVAGNQWLYVDLGQRFTVSRIKLFWDVAYAAAYQLQVSGDAASWTNVYSTTTGNGAVDEVKGLATTARYVRVLTTVRGSHVRSYSLRELEVYP